MYINILSTTYQQNNRPKSQEKKQLSTLRTLVKKLNCALVDNVEKSYPHNVNRCITKKKFL